MDVISTFSVESEYQKMADVIFGLIWKYAHLTELGFTLLTPVRLNFDYQTAIHIALIILRPVIL